MVQLSKENKVIKLITAFFVTLLILLFLSWFYIFNIYEVKIIFKKFSSSNYDLELVPLNSLGKRAPWRSIKYSYKIVEGKENIKKISESENVINLQLEDDSIQVKLEINTDKTQNIFQVEIPNHNME